MQLATSVKWALTPGTTITVTPLFAEP